MYVFNREIQQTGSPLRPPAPASPPGPLAHPQKQANRRRRHLLTNVRFGENRSPAKGQPLPVRPKAGVYPSAAGGYLPQTGTDSATVSRNCHLLSGIHSPKNIIIRYLDKVNQQALLFDFPSGHQGVMLKFWVPFSSVNSHKPEADAVAASVRCRGVRLTQTR